MSTAPPPAERVREHRVGTGETVGSEKKKKTIKTGEEEEKKKNK